MNTYFKSKKMKFALYLFGKKNTAINKLKYWQKIRFEKINFRSLKISHKKGKTNEDIVILGRKYYFSDSKQLSLDFTMLVAPISKIYETSKIRFYDIETFVNPIKWIQFMKDTLGSPPDLILISDFNPKSSNFMYFSIKIWKRIKNSCKTSLFILIGWDTISKSWWKIVRKSDFLDYIFLTDNPVKKYVKFQLEEKIINVVIHTVTPVKKILNISNRPYDLWFVGQTSSYRLQRIKFIETLDDLSIIKFIKVSNSRSQQISHSEYKKSIRNTKIALNFSGSYKNSQLKSRVWDILLSGAVLLEERNDQTQYYLEENIHYLAFTSVPELKSKILYLLANPEILQQIAESGYKRALELTRKFGVERSIKNLINNRVKNVYKI